MAQLKKFELTVTNLVSGKVHTTSRTATSKRAAVEDYYVALASSVIYGDVRGQYRIKAELVGLVSAAAIDSKHAAELNAKAESRAARRRADKKAAAERRAAKAAAENATEDTVA